MSITTRTGDDGHTRLFSGEQVSKTDPRPACYGDMDEAFSWLGYAKAVVTREELRPVLHTIQETLFRVGHELATDVAQVERIPNRITAADVEWLDGQLATFEAVLPRPTGFVIPGESMANGVLHIARAVVRRTERGAVGLQENQLLTNGELVRYLNRLSDLLWVLANYEAHPEVSLPAPSTR